MELQENNWKVLLNAISRFIEDKNKLAKLNDIYHQGLQVFLGFPHSTSASLYMLSNDDFEFNLKNVIPQDFENFIPQIYNENIENGNIGNALEKIKVMAFEHEHTPSNTKGIILVPLKVSLGVLGLVVITHSLEGFKIDSISSNLIDLHASLFGASIESFYHIRELSKSNNLLEQKVTARTFDLTQVQRETKAILDSVLTGIIVYDKADNKIIKVNPIATQLIDINEMELLSSNVTLYLPFLNFSTENEASNFSNSEAYESHLITKEGNLIPILRTSAHLRIGNKVLGIESFSDISKLKLAEKALKEANEILEMKVLEKTEDLQLLIHKLKNEISERELAEKEILKMLEKEKELNELKSRFVNMVSHEFRTPLTIIRTSAQMIEKFDKMLSTQDKDNFIKKIISNVDNLTELIENMLFIGKSDSKATQINKNEVNLIEFTQNIINDIKISFDKDRLIEFDFTDSCSSISIEQKLVRLIISNLLSNAIKYSPKEKPVNLKLNYDDNNLVIQVTDFGIGIPDEHQNKIFDLFFRSNNVGTISGTGLGLTVVYESVQKLNGKIDLSSKVNEGTSFKIDIPVVK